MRLIEKTLVRALNGRLSSGLRQWMWMVSQSKRSSGMQELEAERARLYQQAEEQRMRIVEARAKRVLGQWRSGLLSRVLDAWVGYCQESSRHRHVVGRVAALIRSRTKGMVMRSWAEFASARVHVRRHFVRMCSRIAQLLLRRCIGMWVLHIKQFRSSVVAAQFDHAQQQVIFARTPLPCMVCVVSYFVLMNLFRLIA
jgi:hypothetical protein